MQRIRSLFLSLERDQRGLTTVEYAIVLCVIVAVAVGAWDWFGAVVLKGLTDSTTAVETSFEPGAEKPK
jgi:Flp pilus assembly pilin Flp